MGRSKGEFKDEGVTIVESAGRCGGDGRVPRSRLAPARATEAGNV